MIVKSLLVGALSLASPLSFAFDTSEMSPAAQTYSHPYVKQVVCNEGKGTAFMIEGGKFLSIAHVTTNTGCTIDGAPFIVDYTDGEGDFSILTVPGQRGTGIPISCDGFQDGGIYYALGYARGLQPGTSITLKANSLATLLFGRGIYQVFAWVETVIPGQSGGPIMGGDGKARGMVNAYNSTMGLSWSRPLSETIICGAQA